MEITTLLADPTAIRIEKIIPDHSSLTLEVRATRTQTECPRCHCSSARVHSYYSRTMIARAQELALSFVRIIRERSAEELREWLINAQGSSLPEFQSFAKSFTDDLRAVKASLNYEWSNGQVEGQVHRLKMIKRQMYGRAKLDLLRARVLHVA